MQSLSIGPATVMLANTVYALPAVQSILYTTGSPTITQSSTADFAASTAVTLTDGYATLTGSFLRCTTQITVTLRKGAVGGIGITGPTPVVSGNIVVYDGTDGSVVADSGSSIADITAAAAAVVVAGPIPESAVTDGALLARVAGTETISGAWTHSGATTFSNTATFSGLTHLNSGIEFSGYKFMYLEDDGGLDAGGFTWTSADLPTGGTAKNDTFLLHLWSASTSYSIYSIAAPAAAGRILTICSDIRGESFYLRHQSVGFGDTTPANRIFCPLGRDLRVDRGASVTLCYVPENSDFPGEQGWLVIDASMSNAVQEILTIVNPGGDYTYTGPRIVFSDLQSGSITTKNWILNGEGGVFSLYQADDNLISLAPIFRTYEEVSDDTHNLAIFKALVGATKIEAALNADSTDWTAGVVGSGAYVVNVTSDDPTNIIRGIRNQREGFILRLYCNSTRFWVAHEDVLATDIRRIHCPGATGIQLQQYGCITLRYNEDVDRWQVISQS